MGKRFIVAEIHDMSPVPKDCVYMGNGQFDFVIESKDDPYNITKKLAEYDQDKAQYHKDKTFKKNHLALILKFQRTKRQSQSQRQTSR